jgi:glyoxylase-like metal-dependent hydrolase (beta-lactamase superfamily II)
MKFYHLQTGMLGVNTYFLVNEQTNEGVMIDGGENYERVSAFALAKGFTIKAELLTHAHFDHAGNAGKFQRDGVKIYISKIEEPKLSQKDMGSVFGRTFENIPADETFVDNEELVICGIKIKVILTPGHTNGSATFMVDNMLFTGDTLFLESIGRTDFATGSYSDIEKSIKRLYKLDGNFTVYPGHGEFSTLDHERKNNAFIRE